MRGDPGNSPRAGIGTRQGVGTAGRPVQAAPGVRAVSFRTAGWTWFGIYCFSIVAFFLVVRLSGRTDPIWGADGIKYYAYLRSVMVDGDLDFTREWESHYPGVMKIPEKTETGHAPDKLPVGFSLFSLPFFLLGDLLYRLAGLFGPVGPPDGFSPYHEYAVCIGSMTYGLAGIFLSRRLVRRYAGEAETFAAITVVWLSTDLIYYFFKEPFMSHILSLAVVAAFLNVWHDGYGETGLRRWLLLGLLGGLVAMVRLQDAGFLILPGIEVVRNFFVWRKGEGEKAALLRTLRNVLGMVCVAAVTFTPQWIAWKQIFGSAIVYPYRGERFFWLHPKLLAVLFSSNHGLFFFAPLLVLSLVGLFFFRRESNRFFPYFLAAFLVQLYVNAAWWNWWMGISFGARGFLSCMPIFFLGMAVFLKRVDFARRWKIFVPLFGAAFLYNGLLLLSYETGLIPLAGEFSFLEWLGRLGRLPRLILDRLR
jgi:hypothetical protein